MPLVAGLMGSLGKVNSSVPHCSRFLSPAGSTQIDESSGRVLVIVNSKDFHRGLMELLWNRCKWHLCADGGANRLFDSLPTEEERLRFIPDRIVGDLDSLRADVQTFYEAHGCVCELVFDQDRNDLDKTLMSAQYLGREAIILCGFGGRFDQQMAHIHSLYSNLSPAAIAADTATVTSSSYTETAAAVAATTAPVAPDPSGFRFDQLSIVDVDNVTFLLAAGRHTITPVLGMEGPVCGLLPIGGPCVVSTTGLKWNLSAQALAFGGLVSSSNVVVDPVVYVETSSPLVWTISLHVDLP